MSDSMSVFARYYAREDFTDRYAAEPGRGVDVIIPVLSTNELWEKNLISIYREIPVNRLLLGDGGCADETLTIARRFPRVQVFDHSAYKTLGYSIKELIKSVETEWFIYLHSDVYLPDGWFDAMAVHQPDYDWFGCPMRITAMVEYPLKDDVRPYAGSQMGRKEAFIGGLDRIDDDYVYRQEDFVFARIVEDGNFRHGRIENTFHYHQVMPRIYGRDGRARTIKRIQVDVQMAPEEERITAETQLRGIVKYLRPAPLHIQGVQDNLRELVRLGPFDLREFRKWVAQVNPEWLAHIPRSLRRRRTIGGLIRALGWRR